MQITVIFPERNHVQVSFTTKLLLFFFFYLENLMKFSIWRRKKAKKQFVLYFAKGKKFYYLRKIASLLFNELWRQQQRVIINQSQRAEIMTQKKKNRENNHHILFAKNIFFADDYAIDKNFKNKKLQLKQKGVRWDECYMCFHCYTLVIANNSGNKKMLECWIITLQTCYNIFAYVWSSNSISKQFFRNYYYMY